MLDGGLIVAGSVSSLISTYDLWLLGLVLLLLVYVAFHQEIEMATTADLQKLIENMKRAGGMLTRASADADKHAAIMDSFEQRLNVNAENMSKIEEYEKLMAQLDTGNGGPTLAATFPSSVSVPPVVNPDATGLVSNSTKGVGRIGS